MNTLFRMGVTLLFALWWFHLPAQNCRFHISGQILNADTREPVPFATVLVKESAAGAVADELGRYEIRDLCAGTYTLVCSHISCDHAEHLIVLESHEDSLDFSLHEHSVGLADVLVRAKAVPLKTTQALAEVKGSRLESLQSLNIAEAIRSIPGVSVLNTGATIAKPVIQGLHSNRILVLNNGVQLRAINGSGTCPRGGSIPG
ncbi:MAG: TonB-dependent receptor [Saprospiraceae bacterium]|nr:TonB-dependent receptor [Saprospiraceae bacterium]